MSSRRSGRPWTWERFVVLGDSVAEGIGDPVAGYLDASWADQLAAMIAGQRPAMSYVNLGRRGLLAAEVRETQLTRALSLQPDLAAVVCGGNDMFKSEFDVAGVEAELDLMVGALHRSGADVFTFGLFDISQTTLVPEPYRQRVGERLRMLADVTAQVARRHRATHVDFSQNPASADASLYSDDAMHLNRKGHALVALLTASALGLMAPFATQAAS